MNSTQAENIIATISVIKELKLPTNKVTKVISNLKPLSGRGEKLIINFDNIKDLRVSMFEKMKRLYDFDENEYSLKPKITKVTNKNLQILKTIDKNFFMTCPISRCSKTMAECTKGKF